MFSFEFRHTPKLFCSFIVFYLHLMGFVGTSLKTYEKNKHRESCFEMDNILYIMCL